MDLGSDGWEYKAASNSTRGPKLVLKPASAYELDVQLYPVLLVWVFSGLIEGVVKISVQALGDRPST